MKLYKSVQKVLLALFSVACLVACDEDFTEVGSSLVDEVNFETNITELVDLVAFTRNFDEGVQTNSFPVAAFGVYNDPVYGQTVASYVSQVTASRYDPNFGDNPVLDSVYFTMPYFSRIESTDEDGNSTYTLDSIFRRTGPMKLSLYRSNYFINNLDPDSDFTEPAAYYNNSIANFSGVEGDLLFVIDSLVPSNQEIILEEEVEDVDGDLITQISERLAPALRVKMDSLYWTQAILDREGEEVLFNQNNFRNYFRGLYFKIEPVDGEGSYVLVNPDDTSITLFYTSEGEENSETGETADEPGTFTISLGGIDVLNIDYDENPDITAAIAAIDETEGAEQLFLKGGNGNIVLIDLFGIDDDNGNGIPDEEEDLSEEEDEDQVPEQLELLRECNVIINEANLTFFVEQDALGSAGTGEVEPERVFLYDFENNQLLIDQQFDNSTGVGPVNASTNFLGRLTRETEGDLSSPGVSYRVRITQHINEILQGNSENVRLALTVTQNVQLGTSVIIKGTEDEDDVAKRVPLASVVSQEGTILHGNLSDDPDKRLKLRLYYTFTEAIAPDSPCGQLLDIN